ncbi:MAG: hypothetical protein M0036_02740 [Desulfobacteraceae bacterium]|nr:hypothetical protein [Desulfobacteraceae bacterium]
MQALRRSLEHLSQQWITQGVPSREQVMTSGQRLLQGRSAPARQSLWSSAPRLVTASLDDSIGQGLEVIHLFARVMGLVVTPLGLMQRPEAILAACHSHRPAYLGLTVLQPDSEEDLARIGLHLPPDTCLIAGGPAFRYDPEMAERCGVHYVAANVAYFIDFVLNDARWTSLA